MSRRGRPSRELTRTFDMTGTPARGVRLDQALGMVAQRLADLEDGAKLGMTDAAHVTRSLISGVTRVVKTSVAPTAHNVRQNSLRSYPAFHSKCSETAPASYYYPPSFSCRCVAGASAACGSCVRRPQRWSE